MSFLKKITAAAMIGAATLGLSACATGLPTKVTRFQALPAPQGQSFYVVPGEGRAKGGGLEWSRYAALVSQQMQAQGYAPAASPEQATMIVQLGYDVDKGTDRVVVDDFGPRGFGGYGAFGSRYDPFYGIYYGRPYYSRFGYYGGFRSPFYYGWDDPFWFGSPDVRQYTEYKSELDLDIRRRADNEQLFDGRAQARSTTDDTQVLVPNLIEAIFTGFPGRNGETIKITVPAQKKK